MMANEVASDQRSQYRADSQLPEFVRVVTHRCGSQLIFYRRRLHVDLIG